MVDVGAHVQPNTDVQWNTFSSHDYWRRNYSKLQAEDQEIIRHVSHFFTAALRAARLSSEASTSAAGRTSIPPC